MCPDDIHPFQVYITRSGDGECFNVSMPVSSLAAATEIVEELDQDYLDWEAEGFPNIKDETNPLLAYEGCDVYAKQLPDGPTYYYKDYNEWEILR